PQATSQCRYYVNQPRAAQRRSGLHSFVGFLMTFAQYETDMSRVMTKPRKVLLIATAALLLGTAAHAGSQTTLPPLAELIPKGNQGNAVAQFALGVKYYYGEGAPQDYAEAMKWYRKAADQGDTRAEFMVGFSYIRGKGVPTDFVQAHMWLSLVAASDGENQQVAAQQRDALATMMSRAQIAEAERLTREWKPNK